MSARFSAFSSSCSSSKLYKELLPWWRKSPPSVWLLSLWHRRINHAAKMINHCINPQIWTVTTRWWFSSNGDLNIPFATYIHRYSPTKKTYISVSHTLFRWKCMIKSCGIKAIDSRNNEYVKQNSISRNFSSGAIASVRRVKISDGITTKSQWLQPSWSGLVVYRNCPMGKRSTEIIHRDAVMQKNFIKALYAVGCIPKMLM